MSSNITQALGGWSCPSHSTFISNLNRCAWPDCPHGVAENSVKANIPGIDNTEIFHRMSWHGLNGDTIHDWRIDKMPNWFGILRPYSYFATQLVGNTSPDQMFHYTSADGALAILQSGQMRFTDYAYLNDTREVTYGLNVMRTVLNSGTYAVDSRALSELKAHVDGGDPFASYNIYTASFSSEPDSLSQFRLYGPIALGFETNPIGFGYPKGDSHLGHVVYDQASQTQLIETYFSLLSQSEEKDASLIKSDEKKQVSTDYLVSHLLQIVALFKHPAFSDERELRLLYSEPLEIMDSVSHDMAQRQFRVSGGMIVPFTDSSEMRETFSSDKRTLHSQKLPLKSVVIGPTAHAKALAKGVRDLLSFQGYHDVEVSLSEAPLRV